MAKHQRKKGRLVYAVDLLFFGAPGGIRTHYPRLRKPILYPNELRAQKSLPL